MEKILVTGGAGYIGSHIVKNLVKEGYEVIVFDNLSSGFLEPIETIRQNFGRVVFFKGDISKREDLESVFEKYEIAAVMHLAAKIDAAESVKKPDLYFDQNFKASVVLVETMAKFGVKKLVFSSTAAVYGAPKYTPVDEKHPTNPLSPYGQSKLDFEKYLQRVKNLDYVVFRYFNVGGSDPEGLLGKSHLNSQDLMENVLKVALEKKDHLDVFGKDYNTSDGTPVRDFVHVEDLANAHILALKKISLLSEEIFNLGSEHGFTVKEVVEAAKNIIGKKITVKYLQRREGDISVSVATAAKAKKVLGWDPQFSDLQTIIKTDWNWRKDHKNGYKK